MEWSLDPSVILWLCVAEGLYLRALRILRRRGVTVPVGQKVLWHLGIALWVVGLTSPIDSLGEDLLSAHMAQHLLIADLAAPLLLAGARNPVFGFLMPRPLLLALARRHGLRRAYRTLRRPLVAIPVYALVLYGWHISFAFQAAVEHPLVHALQHASFVGVGILVWWSAIEPKRRRLRGELWKIGHILGARMVGMFLGMGFVFIRHPIYTDVYGTGDRPHGFSALGDQQTAGAMMVSLDILIMAFALCFFFFKAAQEEDRQQRVTSAGLPAPRPDGVDRLPAGLDRSGSGPT